MFSQNNEDRIIDEFFGSFIGTFLDMGANDGITLSNTYALHRKNWQGTLVEASPMAYKMLLDTYAGNQMYDFIHAAIGTYNGEITLHESGTHLNRGDVSLLSTVVPDEMKRWKKESFTEVTVPCVNFTTLLGLTKHKKFDFISIDIEGMELEVLPQMDLVSLGCQLLCVEYNGKEQPKYDAIVLPQGFKLIHKNGENLIYGKN
jgi:FkbM family methyltransferase